MPDHGMSSEDYRSRWGLSADYPIVAPKYAEKRRELAKTTALGESRGRAAVDG